MIYTLLFISGPEIIIIFIFILLLFGAKKIPEIARGLGKGLNEFKKAANDIKKEINESGGDITKDIKDIKDKIK
ncbi:twin-arginine translocase TatA/TatE family subunit [Bacteroidota bacterium]